MADIHKFIRFFSLLAAFLFSTTISAQDPFPAKPEPAIYVHDYSGWLQPGQRNALEAKLRRYFDSTSTQIVVMIRPDLGEYDRATYAIELGNRWGIGRKSKNNGIVVLVKTEQPDRGVFIATGYGTEGAVPDILAGRIIRNVMAPLFRENRYYDGVNAGIDQLIVALGGEFVNDGPETQPLTAGEGLLIALVVLLLFGLFIFMIVKLSKRNGGDWYNHNGPMPRRNNRRNDWPGGGWWMGGGGGNWGSGGGGWGGGGGSFGGGSFGGGGAGGDW